jgi:hypothetical protein
MARQIEAAFEECREQIIKQICLKQLTGILNLDSLVKKIHQPTKKNNLQEEIEDEDDGKKTPGIFTLDSLVKEDTSTNRE